MRSPNFRQYFATSTGVSPTARNVRIDFGNEVTTLPPDNKANVSECQVIMDFYTFKAMYKLFGRTLKEIENTFGKIDMKEEKELAEKLKLYNEEKQQFIEKSIKKSNSR